MTVRPFLADFVWRNLPPWMFPTTGQLIRSSAFWTRWRFTTGTRRTPLLLPDERNPRPGPDPKKRNPRHQPMTDADRLINPIQFFEKLSQYDLRADQTSHVFPSPTCPSSPH